MSTYAYTVNESGAFCVDETGAYCITDGDAPNFWTDPFADQAAGTFTGGSLVSYATSDDPTYLYYNYKLNSSLHLVVQAGGDNHNLLMVRAPVASTFTVTGTMKMSTNLSSGLPKNTTNIDIGDVWEWFDNDTATGLSREVQIAGIWTDSGSSHSAIAARFYNAGDPTDDPTVAAGTVQFLSADFTSGEVVSFTVTLTPTSITATVTGRTPVTINKPAAKGPYINLTPIQRMLVVSSHEVAATPNAEVYGLSAVASGGGGIGISGDNTWIPFGPLLGLL